MIVSKRSIATSTCREESKIPLSLPIDKCKLRVTASQAQVNQIDTQMKLPDNPCMPSKLRSKPYQKNPKLHKQHLNQLKYRELSKKLQFRLLTLRRK
jgi:hypothetical protein